MTHNSRHTFVEKVFFLLGRKRLEATLLKKLKNFDYFDFTFFFKLFRLRPIFTNLCIKMFICTEYLNFA